MLVRFGIESPYPLSSLAGSELLSITLISLPTCLYTLELQNASVSAQTGLPCTLSLPWLFLHALPHQLLWLPRKFGICVEVRLCFLNSSGRTDMTGLPLPPRAGRIFVFGRSCVFLECYPEYILHISCCIMQWILFSLLRVTVLNCLVFQRAWVCVVFCISLFYPATLVFVLPAFLCFLSSCLPVSFLLPVTLSLALRGNV